MSTKMYLRDAKLIMAIHCGDSGLYICKTVEENEVWATRFLQSGWIEISPNQSKAAFYDNLVVYRFKPEIVRRAADVIVCRLPK